MIFPMTNIARKIVARFGGAPALARALGLPNYRTVQSWCDRGGHIPAKQQPLVLAAGQALDPPLTPADFFATEETADAAPQKERSRHRAAAD